MLSREDDVGTWVLLCGAWVLLCGAWVLLCLPCRLKHVERLTETNKFEKSWIFLVVL